MTAVRTFFCAILALFIACADLHGDSSPAPGAEGSFWKSISNFFLPHLEDRKIVFEKESPYHRITVEDDSQGLRHLVFSPNRGSQGVWNPADPESLVSPYCRRTALFLAMNDGKNDAKNILFIGLGAGIMPRFVARRFPEAQIDVVEIDPAVPEIAEKYFGLETKSLKLRIIVADGRDYVNRNTKAYDMIFLDAYDAEKIPFHLTTVEFFQKLRKSLSGNGFISANIADIGNGEFMASELRTVISVFPETEAYSCGNRMSLLAFSFKDKFPEEAWIARRASELDSSDKLGFSLAEIAEGRLADDEIASMTERGTILTDDHAPIEKMVR